MAFQNEGVNISCEIANSKNCAIRGKCNLSNRSIVSPKAAEEDELLNVAVKTGWLGEYRMESGR